MAKTLWGKVYLRIEHEARRKYLARQLKADGSILIRTTDLS